MSSRAAWRLETLGFTQVYRYTPGKQDWLGAGLPREGRLTSIPSAIDARRTDMPTSKLADRTGEVRERMQVAGWDVCPVINERCIVLGLLNLDDLEVSPETPVEDVMGYAMTFRPNADLSTTSELMRHLNVRTVVITTSDGELIGILKQEDADRRLAEEMSGP